MNLVMSSRLKLMINLVFKSSTTMILIYQLKLKKMLAVQHCWRCLKKQKILLKDAIKQWGNIAGLVAGFIKHDYDLISRSLEDFIIEPVRSILIPGFDDIKKVSKEAGALGGGISGSGPSIFMLSKDAQ